MFKSNISPLVAEQYKRKKLFIGTRNGERVIVDPVITVSRVYMVSSTRTHHHRAEPNSVTQYFYLLINIGALVGQIAMTYSEKVR